MAGKGLGLSHIFVIWFNSFKNSIMRQESTQFKMTTSWFTKTKPGPNNGFHKKGIQ